MSHRGGPADQGRIAAGERQIGAGSWDALEMASRVTFPVGPRVTRMGSRVESRGVTGGVIRVTGDVTVGIAGDVTASAFLEAPRAGNA